jgi:hypothetical protein
MQRRHAAHGHAVVAQFRAHLLYPFQRSSHELRHTPAGVAGVDDEQCLHAKTWRNLTDMGVGTPADRKPATSLAYGKRAVQPRDGPDKKKHREAPAIVSTYE